MDPNLSILTFQRIFLYTMPFLCLHKILQLFYLDLLRPQTFPILIKIHCSSHFLCIGLKKIIFEKNFNLIIKILLK
jgi:hypothetical protein